MAKGNKNTGGDKKKTAVPEGGQNRAGSTEHQESTANEPAATQPVKSVSVQSVTNECIALLSQLSRRERAEVLRNIRRAI